ncbi:hypothetical protein F4778DRAFT_782917 [Xylariomycetidae sp. FL2044]|nr:hypothetical protein F4778DRAFT_782917 [Xylariomycetidae sp. FL2044]
MAYSFETGTLVLTARNPATKTVTLIPWDPYTRNPRMRPFAPYCDRPGAVLLPPDPLAFSPNDNSPEACRQRAKEAWSRRQMELYAMPGIDPELARLEREARWRGEKWCYYAAVRRQIDAGAAAAQAGVADGQEQNNSFLAFLSIILITLQLWASAPVAKVRGCAAAVAHEYDYLSWRLSSGTGRLVMRRVRQMSLVIVLAIAAYVLGSLVLEARRREAGYLGSGARGGG